nr:hypothetical protein [Tanacetum cinerariifolium]
RVVPRNYDPKGARFLIASRFPTPPLAWATHRCLEKEPPHSITTWEDLVSKFINEFFPPSRTTSLHNEISNFEQKFDQDSLNATAGGNLLERITQEVLTIIENKSKVRNSRSKSIASQVKACDTNSNSEIAKLTHAVNEQTSAMTTAMTAMLRQFQATPPPAPVKAVEETCVTCGGAHLYYQCLAAGGNTFPELRDNIQEYVSAAAVQYNQGLGSLPSNTVANPKGELKAITTRSRLVIDGPTVPTPPTSVNPKVDEHVEETFMDPDLTEYTIKVPPPPVPKYKPPYQREFVVHQRDPLYLNIPYPSRMLKQKQQEKDEVQIQNFWQMFKKLHVNITLADALILMPKYQKCSKLSCASINLMPLSIWKKLALPELISTRMTLELANRAICTPTGIARDVFVSVGKFTFPADFVIVDYESDPRVPLILGRPFLRTAHALIDVHGEEMILHDGDERLTLNMKHNTASYSNHPHRESANLINSFNVSKGCNWLSEILPDIDAFNNIHPHFDDDPLSGSTTYSANSLLEEFTDELALITYPPDYDDNLQFDIEFDLEEIEFLLYQGKDSSLKDWSIQTDRANLDDYFVDPLPEMFTEEHAQDYSSPPKFDVYLDDFLENESYANNFYDDPFDSEGEKIKESKLLMNELDLPYVPKSRMLLPFSTKNKKKVFKPGIHTSGKDYPDCEVFRALSFCKKLHILSFILGIQYPNLID